MSYIEKNKNASHLDSLDDTDVRKPKKKPIKTPLLMVSPFCLIILTGIYVLFFYRQNISAAENKAKLQYTYVFVTAQNLKELLADNLAAIESFISESILENTVNEDSSVASPSVDYDGISAPSDTYDFSRPVPLTNEVDISYFNDAVFIGNSLTVGFTTLTGIPATSYAYKALTVRKVFTQDVIEVNGEKMSPMEALQKTEFNKIYIMFGINETGWVYSSVFIEEYQKVIDEVRKINPEAVIYVQSVLPVSAEVSAANSDITNERIREYNDLIQKLAEENKIYYVNVAEVMTQEDGSLPDDAAADGIHLKKSYCEKWLAYLQTHTV